MTKELYRRYVQFNEHRERIGLPRLGRRQFLKVLAAASATLSVPWIHACGTDDSDDDDGKDKTDDGGREANDGGQQDAAPAFTCPECAHVGIAQGDDIVETVRTAIDLAGGLSQIKGGDTVVIKPNLCGAFPYSTRSEVTRAVIQAVKQFTDGSKIIVADAAAFGIDTRMRAEEYGTVQVCTDEGAVFDPFDENPYVGFQDPDWETLGEEKQVPALLNPHDPQYDHFINVPMLKNHEAIPLAEYTCCLKNFVGILPYVGEGSRTTPGVAGIHTENIGGNIGELGRIVPNILMNVVDAITPAMQHGPGGEANGLPPMITADARLIIACHDRVACDCVSLAVLRHYAIEHEIDRPYVYKAPAQQAQVVRAAELGLGVSDPENIELVGEEEELLEMFRAQLT